MNLAKTRWKVVLDMTLVQLNWVFWFVAIVLAVYVVSSLFGGDVNTGNQLGRLALNILTGEWDNETAAARNPGLLAFILHPAKIFMLVCGILSTSIFLPFFVKQGVTRKDHFYGSVVSAAIIAILIMGAAGILHLLEYVLLGPAEAVSGTQLVLAAFNCALFIFAYYVAGWLIGSGFYRYEGGGLLFIPIAVALWVIRANTSLVRIRLK